MILELALSASLTVPQPAPTGFQLKLGDLAEPRVTRAVLVVAATTLLVSELIILAERRDGHIVPTISQVMQAWGAQYNTLPFLGAAMVTHWWLNQNTVQDAHTRGAVFAALALSFVLWDTKVALFGASDFEKRLRNPPYLALGIGATAGALFWAQKVRF